MPRRLWSHRHLIGLLLGGLGLLLAGCAKNAPQDTFKPKGTEAKRIDHLAVPVFIIAGVVGLLVGAAVIVIIIKFRQRPGDDDRVPAQIHGNTKLEIGWTIAPAVLLAIIAVPTVATVFKLADKPRDAMEVQVVGQQWWWEFDYPGEGVITANELVIPVGQPVVLHITSRDVIHSFWIPRLNGKKDAVPGRIQDLNLEADTPGEYWGQCTEFCGLSHANMRIRAIALSQGDFAKWIANQKQNAVTPTDAAAVAGQNVFKNRGCAGCHQINGVNVAQNVPLIAGAAPNLTHLMSRDVFAGAMFDLETPGCTVTNTEPTGTPPQCLNRAALEAWLRDPGKQKPMYAKGGRGMPNLNLSETEIDNLVAYLSTLK